MDKQNVFCYNLNFFPKSRAQLRVQRLQTLLKENREYFLAPEAQCVAPETIHTPPTEGTGNSLGMGGSQRPKNFK